MPSVCIDGWNLALAKGSGIQVYGRNLLRNIQGLGLSGHVLYGPNAGRSREPLLNEIALVDAQAGGRQKKGLKRAATTVLSRYGRDAHPVPISGSIYWPETMSQSPQADVIWSSTELFNIAGRSFRQYRRPVPVKFCAEEGVHSPDVMHWTCPIPCWAPNIPNIYTVHDLIPLMLPSTTLDDKKSSYDMLRVLTDRADHIVTVSETTRADLVNIMGVEPGRVTATYQAVLPDVGEVDEAEALRTVEGVLGLEWKNYFLFYGAIEPKKNLGRLVQAYVASRSQTPLVVVAGRQWLAENETALLNELVRHGKDQTVRYLDYLPGDVLRSVVRGAKATLFPSLYEGFGLPLLESMWAGTPVLTSTGGSLPEVAADAALKVDPTDIDRIRDGITALDMDADLRADLAAKGRVRAQDFSEGAYRARLSNVYKAVGVL